MYFLSFVFWTWFSHRLKFYLQFPGIQIHLSKFFCFLKGVGQGDPVLRAREREREKESESSKHGWGLSENPNWSLVLVVPAVVCFCFTYITPPPIHCSVNGSQYNHTSRFNLNGDWQCLHFCSQVN